MAEKMSRRAVLGRTAMGVAALFAGTNVVNPPRAAADVRDNAVTSPGDFMTKAEAASQIAADRATYAPAFTHPSGQIAWNINTKLNFAPRSIGVDGQLYFTYLNKTILRTADPTLATRTSGMNFSGQTPANVKFVTRTTTGYVAVTSDTPTDLANVWFCPNSAGFSTSASDWTMVQATKAVTDLSIAQPRVIAGTSWLLLGEYKNLTPAVARKLWLSTDGGESWNAIRDSVVATPHVNSHWHHSLITATGRIWASQGDLANAWFGYTDDRGVSWVPVPLPNGSPLRDATSAYQQPTQLLDFGETIAATPDRGPSTSGVWAIDPDSGATTVRFPLPSGEVTSTQYGTGPCAQRGREAYLTFPDQGSGSNRAYIVGTGDRGRTWHVVSTIGTAGGSITSGLVGPDLNGQVYLQPNNIPTYASGMMIGTLPSWSSS